MSAKRKKTKSSGSVSTNVKPSLWQHFKFLWGAALVGVIAAYFFYNRDNFLSNYTQETLTAEEIDLWKKSLVDKRFHFHEKMCSSSTSVCFNIVDSAYSLDGELAIERNMMIGDSKYSFSGAFLTVPSDIDKNNMDIRKWKIQKHMLASAYAKVMVAFAFAMEGLEYSTSKWQNVLMIGLGGGVMINFLSTLEIAKLNITTVELDPEVRDVAVKWFHLVENDQHRVIIDDGTKFIKEEAAKGTKYNVVFLDACYTECPAAVFLEPEVIKDTSKLLNDKGVLAINVLTKFDKRKEQSDHILELYKSKFASCFLFYVKLQQVLLCSHRSQWTLEEQPEYFYKKMEEVDRHFNFGFT